MKQVCSPCWGAEQVGARGWIEDSLQGLTVLEGEVVCLLDPWTRGNGLSGLDDLHLHPPHTTEEVSRPAACSPCLQRSWTTRWLLLPLREMQHFSTVFSTVARERKTDRKDWAGQDIAWHSASMDQLYTPCPSLAPQSCARGSHCMQDICALPCTLAMLFIPFAGKGC